MPKRHRKSWKRVQREKRLRKFLWLVALGMIAAFLFAMVIADMSEAGSGQVIEQS